MNNINKLTDVINYDTDSDDLIRIQFKDGVVRNGYVLDYDDELCDSKPNSPEPRFVFSELGSGDVSEEYFEDVENAMIITGGAK